MCIRDLLPIGPGVETDNPYCERRRSAPVQTESAASPWSLPVVNPLQTNPSMATTVLVVDDDPTFCIVMREILQRQGFAVHTAVSAQKALSLLEEITPDIILTDIMMPEIDGITLIRRLRAKSAWSAIPTLVVSARGRHEVAEAQHAGANGYIAKPFSLKQLRDAMDPFLVAQGDGGTTTRQW